MCELMFIQGETETFFGTTLKNKLSSSFKKVLLYEHKNIFFQRNIGDHRCFHIGGELSGANCPGGELSDIRPGLPHTLFTAKYLFND